MHCPHCGRACWMVTRRYGPEQGRVVRMHECKHCDWREETRMTTSHQIGVLTPEGSAYMDSLPLSLVRQLHKRIRYAPAFNAVEN